MRKALLLLATAAMMTGTTMTVEARDRDRSDRADQTSNQMLNEADAQTARMKVDLRLTTDQEKNWDGFSTAMHDMGKKRIDRAMAMRDDRKTAPDAVNLIDQINRDADSRIERANDWKKLGEAAKPLYDSLDEQQKRRFAELLRPGERNRDRDRDRDRDQDRDSK